MSAALREGLILQMHAGGSDLLVLADRALDVYEASVARVDVAECRKPCRGNDVRALSSISLNDKKRPMSEKPATAVDDADPLT